MRRAGVTHARTYVLAQPQPSPVPATERFACPLSVDEDVTAYTTRCDSDAQFGAHQDAFARQWRGASVATPPNDKDSPAKAVRWAISSAGSTYAAVATVLVVPITDAALQAPNNGRGLLDHPMVFKIGRASQGKLKPGAVFLLLVCNSATTQASHS